MSNIVEQTPQQIYYLYEAAIGSADLIQMLLKKPDRDEKETEAIQRNVKFLQQMLEQTYWTNQNLAPLKKAVDDAQPIVAPSEEQ